MQTHQPEPNIQRPESGRAGSKHPEAPARSDRLRREARLKGFQGIEAQQALYAPTPGHGIARRPGPDGLALAEGGDKAKKTTRYRSLEDVVDRRSTRTKKPAPDVEQQSAAPDPSEALATRLVQGTLPKVHAMGHPDISFREEAGKTTFFDAKAGTTWTPEAFEAFAATALVGDGSSITFGQLAELATEFAAWAATNYRIPSEEGLASGARFTVWHKDDQKPMDWLVEAGKKSEGMVILADALGYLMIAIAFVPFVFDVAYGLAVDAIFSGLTLGGRAAVKGASIAGAFSKQESSGAMKPGQARFFRRQVLADPSVLHRFFNVSHPGVRYDARQGVLELIREFTNG